MIANLRIEWKGLDTLIISAGVSALRPLLTVAGIEDRTSQVDMLGLQHIRDVASSALQGNFMGPLLSVVTYVRVLCDNSCFCFLTFSHSFPSYLKLQFLPLFYWFPRWLRSSQLPLVLCMQLQRLLPFYFFRRCQLNIPMCTSVMYFH